MEHRTVSPQRRSTLLHKFSVTSPSPAPPPPHPTTTIVMPSDSPDDRAAPRAGNTTYRATPPRTSRSAASHDVYSPREARASTGAAPESSTRRLRHDSRSPPRDDTDADGDTADDGGVSSEVLLARKNVELYNMVMERDEELRELRQRAHRLAAELDAMKATVDQRVDQRVKDNVERATAEMHLAHQAAVQKLVNERACMREELMAEAGRVDAMRQEVAAEAARAASLAEEARSPSRSPQRSTADGSPGRSPRRDKAGASSGDALWATGNTHPVVLAAAVAVLAVCALIFTLCVAALSWRAFAGIASVAAGGGGAAADDEDYYDEE